jgi:hypothetical protein
MKHITKDPMYRYLLVLTICATGGLQVWITLFNNFAVEMASLKGHHVGIIQSVREIPGFLTLLVIYVILLMKEHRLSALSVLIMGIGLGVTGFLPSFGGLLVTTTVMSFGYHYYETTNQSLTLQYFDTAVSPYVFGKQRSYASATNIAIGLLIYLMAIVFNYTQMFLVFGLAVVATGLWAYWQKPTRADLVPQRKKMIFKRKYWLYYFLNFMAGARRQIFMAFSVFLLVEKFHYSIQEITLLFVVNNVLGYFISPIIGKAIIRFGERKILSMEYASLILIFLAYAFVGSKFVIAFLYILDHIFFGFSIAIRTYFQKIGDPRDIAPSMAVGFTINHIAAVVLPVIGGLLWVVDYRIPFYGGAAMALISLIAVQKIRIP